MTYAKPELVALTHAVEAIQGSVEKKPGNPDTSGDPDHDTVGAYVADE